jgi:hypothetical protein
LFPLVSVTQRDPFAQGFAHVVVELELEHRSAARTIKKKSARPIVRTGGLQSARKRGGTLTLIPSQRVRVGFSPSERQRRCVSIASGPCLVARLPAPWRAESGPESGHFAKKRGSRKNRSRGIAGLVKGSCRKWRRARASRPWRRCLSWPRGCKLTPLTCWPPTNGSHFTG